MNIAWFSSLSSKSTSGIFSKKILPKLQKNQKISITHFGKLGENNLNFRRLDKSEKFDLTIYNLDNSSESQIYRQILGARPGITIFHDYYFKNMGPESNLQSQWEKVCQSFKTNKEISWELKSESYKHYGPWGYREAAMSLIPCFSSPSGVDQFLSSKKDGVLSWKYNLNIAQPVLLGYPAIDIDKVSGDRVRVGIDNQFVNDEDIYDIIECSKLLGNITLAHLSSYENATDIADICSYKKCIDYRYFDRNEIGIEDFLSNVDIMFLNSNNKAFSNQPYLNACLGNNIPLILERNNEPQRTGVYNFRPGLYLKEDLKEIFKAISQTCNKREGKTIEGNNPTDIAGKIVETIFSNKEKIENFYEEWREFESAAQQHILSKNLGQLDSVFKKQDPLERSKDFIQSIN